MANASVAIYNLPYYTPAPPWWPFEPLTELKPQRGRAIDHLAYSFRDIQPVFERMSNAGVEIVEPISVKEAYGMKSFFVMGPDNVVVEIQKGEHNPLKELFGAMRFNEPTTKMIKEVRRELESKWM